MSRFCSVNFIMFTMAYKTILCCWSTGFWSYNGQMFSLPDFHSQFKSVNISTILTCKLKCMRTFGDLFLDYCLEYIHIRLNCVLFRNRVNVLSLWIKPKWFPNFRVVEYFLYWQKYLFISTKVIDHCERLKASLAGTVVASWSQNCLACERWIC